jgi:hypothetical protein
MGASQDSPMQRYYFDLRDGDGLFIDDEGIVRQTLTQMSIEVRDDTGP